jgi:hypothetical protein
MVVWPGVSGPAIGHHETSVAKRSHDRAAQMSTLLGLTSGDVAVSECGSAKMTAVHRRSTDATRGAGRVRGVMGPSQDEVTILDALQTIPAAERQMVMALILA